MPPCRDIGPDHAQILPCRFERFLGIVPRNKSSVVVKSYIALAPQAVKHCEQAGMPVTDMGPHEFDDGDVVPGLASRAKSMTEHKSQRCLQHRFVCLLKAGFFIKRQDFVGRSQLLISTREETLDLRPINGVRF